MERYGFDDFGRGDSPDGWQGRGAAGGGGYGGFQPGGRGEPGGWSRPEFNVSLGAFGGRPRSRYDASFRGRSAFAGEAGVGATRYGRGRAARGERFTTDRVHARDIMTEGPEAVTPETSLMEVARRMRDLDVGIIPVVTDDEGYSLKGVITDRDIAVRAAAEGKDMKKTIVAEFMSKDVATVREGSTVRDVFEVMKRERVRRVPVTDDQGRLVGIIAQADLAVDYAGMDEEREMEVEEVLERISEPARPRPRGWSEPGYRSRQITEGYYGGGYGRDFGDRLRHGWDALKREAQDLFDRGYDRGWR